MRHTAVPFALLLIAVAACGSRTPLEVGVAGRSSGAPEPGAPPAVGDSDATAFAMDAEPVTQDSATMPTPPIDSMSDAGDSLVIPPAREAGDDGVDAALDAADAPVTPIGCNDAGSTAIYVVTRSGSLMKFEPATATFVSIGHIPCVNRSLPFSMAVSRTGIAYVELLDSSMLRVNTTTLACASAAYVSLPGGSGGTFGMGFAADGAGGETLYLAEDSSTPRLAALDTTTFQARIVGPMNQATRSELTGDSMGRLFAFYGNTIAQIDKTTAKVTPLYTTAFTGGSFAFAAWGGDFYLFVDGSVMRFRPSTGTTVQIGQISDAVVGAGVSTCAPSR
jgi:hypothetical protein